MTKRTTKTTTPQAETVLVLRTCAADMSSSHGFVWPESGAVGCPDWQPTQQCGNGLHGFLWGEGDHDLANWDADAKWLVVSVAATDIIDLDRKVKFPRGEVVFCGSRRDATSYLQAHGGQGRAIIGATATAGYGGTATAGGRGTATAGGRGTATAGEAGTATAGYGGTATAGNRGTATAGEAGTIIIERWNGKRYKFSIGYVGEDGILPNTAYRLDSDGNFIAKEPS